MLVGVLYIYMAKLICCAYEAHVLKVLLHVSIIKSCNIYGPVKKADCSGCLCWITHRAETSLQVMTSVNAGYKLKLVLELKVWL